MLTVYAFRHGKTELNQKKVLQGHIDSPLIPEGLENAHSIAKKLRGISHDGIHSSDLGRAFITAYIVTQDLGDNRPIVTAEELREVSFGDLAGMPIDEAEAQNPGLQRETHFTPNNGESLGAMQQRVVEYLFALARVETPQTVFIATHDCVLNAIYAKYAGIDLGPYNGEHYNAHDAVFKLLVDRDGIAAFTEHLAPPGV